jgi:hypothetical protein
MMLAAATAAAAAVLLLVGSPSGGVDAAGMNTHTMVGLRAAQHYARVRFSPRSHLYNRAIREQPLAVLAGSDFPDFGYAADDLPLPGLTHDAGEAAHWPPFHAGAAQYIRSRPDFEHEAWSEETQKLVAFTFGTAVHYITDETWEGLTTQVCENAVLFFLSFRIENEHLPRQARDEHTEMLLKQ